MNGVALSGSDTCVLQNRVFNDFADGDVLVLSYPNNVAAVKRGKNGNSIYALNETGALANLTIKVLRGSSDDKFLNNLFLQQRNNFAGFTLLQGEFVKNIGDGAGNITYDTYILSGGIFVNAPEGAKDNVEGDTAQSTVTYHLQFSNAPRVIT